MIEVEYFFMSRIVLTIYFYLCVKKESVFSCLLFIILFIFVTEFSPLPKE